VGIGRSTELVRSLGRGLHAATVEGGEARRRVKEARRRTMEVRMEGANGGGKGGRGRDGGADLRRRRNEVGAAEEERPER
jgi:hypothetical protein